MRFKFLAGADRCCLILEPYQSRVYCVEPSHLRQLPSIQSQMRLELLAFLPVLGRRDQRISKLGDGALAHPVQGSAH